MYEIAQRRSDLSACAIGVSSSTTIAGYVADRRGSATAFLLLASVAVAALACVMAVMPEPWHKAHRPRSNGAPQTRRRDDIDLRFVGCPSSASDLGCVKTDESDRLFSLA